MKATLFLLSGLLGTNLLAQTAAFQAASNAMLNNYNEAKKQQESLSNISFIENKGQMHDQNYHPRPDVLFGAMAGNMAFHLKTNGVSYQLTRVNTYKEVEDPKTKEKRKVIDQQTIYRVDLSWINANANLVTSTDKSLDVYNNYYTAGCPEGGVLNVKSYRGVSIHNLYTGINLHYYEKEGQLKHDYIVAPGANYKQIQLSVDGAKVSINKDGSLLLNTPLGKIQEGAPIVFQNGKQLKARWVIDKQTLSFDIENYNPIQELIIDPVTREWGTYYGGDEDDRGRSCSTDATGNTYLVGETGSTIGTIIATTGANQSVFGGGAPDAFIAKFNSSGTRQWSTYYGGTGWDYGYSCSLDASGNVYTAGSTYSTTNIATVAVHQTINGGNNDAFLVKFNSNGIRLWGTYYGGALSDVGNGCCTDALGNVYLTGEARSTSSIATIGAHQSSFGYGTRDAFLVKFNSSGVRQWGTYYGSNASDEGNSCAVDGSGNVYMAGITASIYFIATVGAHQTVNSGGDDAFLVKFNSNGVRQWGTYYGGTGLEEGFSCATDGAGNVYMVGVSGSSSSIATAGAHDTILGGNTDAFLVKFNTNGIRQWGTYYGGTQNDEGLACVTNATGYIYMAGKAKSSGSIATSGAHQTSGYFTGLGDNAAYLIKFNSLGIRQWGTFYSHTGEDVGNSCAVDALGNVYLAGATSSDTSTAIATPGSHQSAYGGGSFDAFLVKFNDCNGLSTATINQTACNSYTWSTNSTTYTSSGTYTATIANAAGCDSIITLNLTINNVNNSISLNGSTITANANGSVYQWVDCNNGNANIPGATNQSFTPTANGNYAVIVSQNGCSSMSNCVIVNVVDVNENIIQNKVSVYPNPSNGFYTISGIKANTNLLVYNTLGEEIFSSITTGTIEQINLSALAKGIYFIRIAGPDSEETHKIIIQ